MTMRAMCLAALLGSACAMMKASPQPDNAMASAEQGYSQDGIKLVQQRLKAEGVYKGDASGKLDDATKTALMDYQRAKGLDASGRPDDATAQALGLRMDQLVSQAGKPDVVGEEASKTAAQDKAAMAEEAQAATSTAGVQAQPGQGEASKAGEASSSQDTGSEVRTSMAQSGQAAKQKAGEIADKTNDEVQKTEDHAAAAVGKWSPAERDRKAADELRKAADAHEQKDPGAAKDHERRAMMLLGHTMEHQNAAGRAPPMMPMPQDSSGAKDQPKDTGAQTQP